MNVPVQLSSNVPSSKDQNELVIWVHIPSASPGTMMGLGSEHDVPE